MKETANQNSTSLLNNTRLVTTSSNVHSSPSTYREHCICRDEDENAAAETLYSMIDIIELTGRTDRLTSCRSFATFMRNKIDGSVRVFSRSCNLRWCPLCAGAKANRIRGNTGQWLSGEKYPKFLTLTLKHNSAPLSEQLDRLYAAFKNLRRIKLWKDRVNGGIWFFQVTKSKQDGFWHPHLHIVISGGYVSKSKLKTAWEKITGDSFIIDIKLIRDHKKVADYVARYSSRPCTLKNRPLDELKELFYALDGRRLCGTFGTAKAAKLTAKPKFEETDWENLGSWFEVTQNILYDENARMIWKAWTTNKPLGAGINLYSLYFFRHPAYEQVKRKHCNQMTMFN